MLNLFFSERNTYRDYFATENFVFQLCMFPETGSRRSPTSCVNTSQAPNVLAAANDLYTCTLYGEDWHSKILTIADFNIIYRPRNIFTFWLGYHCNKRYMLVAYFECFVVEPSSYRFLKDRKKNRIVCWNETLCFTIFTYARRHAQRRTSASLHRDFKVRKYNIGYSL